MSVVDDERISIERAPSVLTENLSDNVNELVNTLNTIGDVYLKVYHGETFPSEKSKKKKETIVESERDKLLDEDESESFFPRYENALKQIGAQQSYEFSPLHMVGDSETKKTKENRRSISMGPEKMGNLSSLGSSVEYSTFRKTTACMMAILASRQYAGRATNAYPLCLFVAPGYNATKEIAERSDSKFEKTSMRRYDRIVFTSDAKTENTLQEEPVHWVAFALLPNKEYWSDRGPYIKVWCNLDPKTMSEKTKTEYQTQRKAIGEAVLSSWKTITESLISPYLSGSEKIFHKETIFADTKDPINKDTLQAGDMDEDADLLYGRMIDYTGSRDPHSIFWPMTQCSMYRGLDMFVKTSSNAKSRMYTIEAMGHGGTSAGMTNLLQKFKKKEGKTKEVLDMSASLLWTTGTLVRGVSLYTRHTSGQFLRQNGYTLIDNKADSPSSSSSSSEYRPLYSTSKLPEHMAYARPHMKKEDVKKITQSVKKTWENTT